VPDSGPAEAGFSSSCVARVLFWGASGKALGAGRTGCRPEAGRREEEGAAGAGLRPGAAAEAGRLTLEIGFQLIPLVDEKQGGQLLGRVRSLRRHLSSEMGFLVPPVHISDNLRLKPREYLFSLRGMEMGRWQTEGAQLLAVSGRPGAAPAGGKETREPAFGVPACGLRLPSKIRRSPPAIRWSTRSP
jgi:flagellar biosynthesis protein FlhA